MTPTQQDRGPRKLPDGYLVGGYFKKGTVLHDRLIAQDPRDIVFNLSDRNLRGKPMEHSQFRKFFGYARRLEYRLRGGDEWERVRQDLLRLQVYAEDAINRQHAPQVFGKLVRDNLKCAVESPDSFLRGFIVHWEAIAAFWPRKG